MRTSVRSALAALALTLSLSACGGGEVTEDEYSDLPTEVGVEQEEPGLSPSEETLMWEKRMELCAIYTNALSTGTITPEEFYNTTQAIEALGCFTS